MNHEVLSALKQTSLYSDGIDYVVVKLPARAITVAAGIVAEIGEAFCVLVADKDEVSLVIPAEAIDMFASRLKSHTTAPTAYRLITFDIELDFNLVGFMAVISQTLANAKVSILPIAAFSRDHILVPTEQFDIAMRALQKLQSGL